MPPRKLDFVDASRAPDQRNRLTGLGIPSVPPGAPGAAPFVRNQAPPWREKLPSSNDFIVVDYAMTLAAGAGSVITSANLTFSVPASMVGWLQNFSFYVLTPTAGTSVRFAIRINESPVPGWDNYQNSPGVANLYREDYSELQVRIPNGAKVDIIATNLNAGGPWTVGGKLAGWYHSQQDEARYWGAA